MWSSFQSFNSAINNVVLSAFLFLKNKQIFWPVFHFRDLVTLANRGRSPYWLRGECSSFPDSLQRLPVQIPPAGIDIYIHIYNYIITVQL